MNEISERIYSAMIDMKRRNLKPTAVYLGYEEYKTVRLSAREGDTFYVGAFGEPEQIFGLRVYRVQEPNHLAVVE